MCMSMKILNSFIVFLLSLMAFLGVVFTTIRISTSSRRKDMDGKITDKRLLWKHEVEGLAPCVGECANDENCVGVFFNRVSNQCQGHSITHGHADGAEVVDDWRYYVQPFGNKYIGDKCSIDSECETTNGECREQTCECKYGYSFSPRTHECLSDCVSYGPDFLEIPDYFISYNNLENIGNVTIDECLQFCRNRTEYTCRSLEYGWVSRTCSLQNVTSLHVPIDWFEDTQREFNISHFLRDCA